MLVSCDISFNILSYLPSIEKCLLSVHQDLHAWPLLGIAKILRYECQM